MKTLTGVPVSPGIVIGKAFLYAENDFPEIPRYALRKTQVESELKRLNNAKTAAMDEVKAVHERAVKEMSKDQADVFAAHLMMLEDPDFHDQIAAQIKDNLRNAEWAVWEIAHNLMQKMMSSPDPVFRERAVDITDVCKRVLLHLLSIIRVSLSELDEDVIVVARDLLPSETLTMNKDHVKAIAMDMGGRTSHTAILARAFNIPAVLGLSAASKEIVDGDILVLDGTAGQVFVNPDKKYLDKYQKADDLYRKKLDAFINLKDLPAETKDGCRVSLKANIEIPEEVDQVLLCGAEGIGLYRSEFLFLTPGKAAEEEYQFDCYSRVLKAMGGMPVTIRTVDIGGDKILPNFQSIDEKNPLLGWRAIRFSLALPALFKTQLRAILRASVFGNVRIMFPLISGIEELEQALALLEEAKEECRKKRQAFAGDIEVGTMIEVPSAAVTSDILAEKSDFFSIGTNDLIQYSLAVDRGNEKVSYLARPLHPAVLRLLKMIIDNAHAKGIKAAMCGEMAGDPLGTALLLGMGLDEFSMSASAIPQIKNIVRGVTIEECRALYEKAKQSASIQENTVLVKSWMAERLPSVII
ncbi:phosphoenolpyruvate--protein phosphotransferase [Leadbettera azotonutricia]|uniref:Phosphoenolpyruvate-protein phosphotransferase n=1 Tax=Leadbettera azotonutricia (strain ATCC BAA-888 / DSM 13862 / ZAS-9) TaxID=545695 RepID=F5YCQ2_LEAAZ|nr:phosphoenolpyruvate--protein phosphotransferase [Leadbettera azotonutricia]AEF81583.1 phosphoenolpyruvate-protein phosphotransferase [Leadbettera azotonutricia ZAS-9]